MISWFPSHDRQRSCDKSASRDIIFLASLNFASNILLLLGHLKEQITDRRAELHLTTNLSLSTLRDEQPPDTDANEIHFEASEFYKNIRVKNIIEWYQSRKTTRLMRSLRNMR